MGRLLNNSRWANLAVIVVLIGSAALALFAGEFLPSSLVDGREWVGYLFIAASLLGLSYFLPETQNRIFSSRQSAIGGCCLFLYFAILHLGKPLASGGGAAPEASSEWETMLVAFIISFVFYWVALWAIRGLRTPRI